jgi:hypothetical protein
MGLSPLLVDTYRRYKRDTKTFTQWLGTTARSTGLIDKIFQDDSDKQVPVLQKDIQHFSVEELALFESRSDDMMTHMSG